MKPDPSLNTAQQEAVLATEGPLLVLAGAGAGKTKVIAERIAQIVRQGIAPQQVLAITFTNKAAGEMRERIIPGPFVCTFHVLGLTLIKENYRLLGLKRFPSIYDRADSLREMKAALKTIGAEEIEPRAALAVASRQKGSGISAGEYAEKPETPYERQIALAWLKYEQALAKDSAMDFDDLLLRAMQLLRDHPELRKKYQDRWQYIHIDEYQDTNAVQAQLAAFLVGTARNICAVGDIDQTIYGWRGAEIANILSFEKKYLGAKIVMLEQNYRSTKTILAAANDVIAKNIYRREKNLFTTNADGEPLSLYIAFDELDEAAFITRKIKELLEEGKQPRDFAVLYRANFQSRAIEEQLLNGDVPYQVLGTRFFERREVKDALSFIRAAVQGSSVDVARVANVPPRGIGKVTLLKILAEREHELTGAIAQKVANFRILLARIRDAAQLLPPSQLVRMVIVETGMDRHFKEDKFEGAERLENLRELSNLAARYDALPIEEALQAFLESAALASDQDELKEEQNSVRLMTVHAAKGLEFNTVFITGLEEGLFPYERQDSDASDKEEERRLMYVALTRAREKVFLCYASYRTIFGAKMPTTPSQFLGDISDDLKQNENPERLGKTIYLD
jgi:DNA helicase-2/ATP-dependent DNA helicase PcrA